MRIAKSRYVRADDPLATKADIVQRTLVALAQREFWKKNEALKQGMANYRRRMIQCNKKRPIQE